MKILPASFEKRMKLMLDQDFTAFSESLSAPVSHSIRINEKKVSKKPELPPVSYCSSGFYLKERPVYTLDPLFHAGAYYVQESSSMFLEQFIRLSGSKKVRVLDLCAAPGGKSTHLASLLSDDSLLVSNEVIRSRAGILSENLKKWGHPNVIVTCNDPKDFSRLPGFFDIIVVDAPCSGEGLFRRDPDAMEEWSEANASLCSQRQKRILADVWPSLAEGGMLVYSTCTYNPAENEENISWLSDFAAIEPVALTIPAEWGIVATLAKDIPCHRFYPHKVKGEGYFTAAVLKREPTVAKYNVKSKASMPLASKTEHMLVNGLVQNPLLSMVKFEDSILAFPTPSLADLELLKANLRIVHAGVRTGEIIRDGFIPAHELAMSNICNRSYFPEVELTHEQALSYLKRDDFKIDFAEKGWMLFTYKGFPLGWAKNIVNRFNNSYPKEWRIRMSTAAYTGEKLEEEARKFPLANEE